MHTHGLYLSALKSHQSINQSISAFNVQHYVQLIKETEIKSQGNKTTL